MVEHGPYTHLQSNVSLKGLWGNDLFSFKANESVREDQVTEDAVTTEDHSVDVCVRPLDRYQQGMSGHNLRHRVCVPRHLIISRFQVYKSPVPKSGRDRADLEDHHMTTLCMIRVCFVINCEEHF